MNKLTLYTLASLLWSTALFANNIQVDNIEVIEDPNAMKVRFDLSWENSWRTSTFEANYDAAWVFMKVKYNGSEWFHVPLCGSNTDIAPAGCELISSGDCMGFFVQRDSDGIGDVSFEGIELESELGVFPTDEIEICVYAIEMVYIPEGPFEVGGSPDPSEQAFQAGDTGTPFTISSENQISLGLESSASLSVISQNSPPDDFIVTPTVLPATFPKGFKSFYSMKYELSQGQYASFLSSLSYTDALERRFDPNTSQFDSGYSISFTGTPSVWTAEFPNRPCNFIDWTDLAIYADWSGLRPMSELEFEKMCRGPRPSIVKEYAWGSSSIHVADYIVDENSQDEQLISNLGRGTTGNALSNVNQPSGLSFPFDCGWAAAQFEFPTRAESGAGFYGVMELSGNLTELVVNIGTEGGREFNRAQHGDGDISQTEVSTWPNYSDESDSDFFIGMGYKGGGIFIGSTNNLRISYRGRVNSGNGTNRNIGSGGRLVRSQFDAL